MFLSPFRILAWFLALVMIGVPAAAVTLFLLAINGSPGECDSNGRTIVADLASAASFQQKWDDMTNALDAGQPSSATFTESEATSRAQLWAEEHDAPVSDLRLCFNAGGGSGSAKIDIPFVPGDVDVLVHGTLDLTGEKPEAEITDVDMGRLPGPVAGRIEDFITRLIDHETDDITLKHDYGLQFADGEVTITGQP
ncbi:MAG: hypothetical protein WEB04_07170 [Dehalococcoidia bacterium]